MIKAVYCTDLIRCRHRYHQDVPSFGDITVHPCPNCGSAGTMIINPDERLTGVKALNFKKSKIVYPLLSMSVTLSLRLAGPSDIFRLHQAAVIAGFTLIGFHGAGSNAADSILEGVQDKSTTEARGKGFAVGSKYDGIPTHWAGQVKGGGTPTILRIYVRGWEGLVFGRDYDWGKMDPDDEVEETGLEIVLRTHIFPYILALPSLSIVDQNLIAEEIWEDCPTHNFRPDEVETMTRVAKHLNVTLNELEKMIEDEDGGGRDLVMAAFEFLNISTD